MYVSLSERATAVHALETERIALFEAVAEIELKQQLALHEFQKVMRKQSNAHTVVIRKLIALEGMIERLI